MCLCLCPSTAQERERAELADRLKRKKAERLQLQAALRDVSEAVRVSLQSVSRCQCEEDVSNFSSPIWFPMNERLSDEQGKLVLSRKT